MEFFEVGCATGDVEHVFVIYGHQTGVAEDLEALEVCEIDARIGKWVSVFDIQPLFLLRTSKARSSQFKRFERNIVLGGNSKQMNPVLCGPVS